MATLNTADGAEEADSIADNEEDDDELEEDELVDIKLLTAVESYKPHLCYACTYALLSSHEVCLRAHVLLECSGAATIRER